MASARVGLVPWLLHGARQVVRDMRRHRLVFSLVGAVWVLALVRTFVHPVPVVPLLFNWTPSLPYHVALMQFQQRPVRRGDLIVFAFAGEAQAHYRGLRGQPFFKRVRGVPGDVVTVSDRTVFVNGEAVGRAKTHAYDGHPLAPIAPVVIPPGHYYVQGIGLHSFDSRYAESGLVRDGQVLGIVQPIF